jgi:VIT1/CCC1 family predicted Fe2+/Mn2+ transporter
VITAGVAEIIAGSIAMGLGGYLAGKTEVDHYKAELKREYYEVDHLPEREKQEVRDVLADYGISKQAQDLVADEISLNKDKWVDFMMKFELGLDEPHPERAKKSAFNIAVSYIIGGFIPLSAYFFTDHPKDGIIYSSIITLFALAAFGYFKSKVTDQPPIQGALRTMLVGALAASAAYFIATWIGA